jgi:hypothetical protein
MSARMHACAPTVDERPSSDAFESQAAREPSEQLGMLIARIEDMKAKTNHKAGFNPQPDPPG